MTTKDMLGLIAATVRVRPGLRFTDLKTGESYSVQDCLEKIGDALDTLEAYQALFTPDKILDWAHEDGTEEFEMLKKIKEWNGK